MFEIESLVDIELRSVELFIFILVFVSDFYEFYILKYTYLKVNLLIFNIKVLSLFSLIIVY